MRQILINSNTSKYSGSLELQSMLTPCWSSACTLI